MAVRPLTLPAFFLSLLLGAGDAVTVTAEVAVPTRASGDTVVVAAPVHHAAPGSRVTLPVTVDMGTTGEALGSIQGALRVDTAFATLVGVVAGNVQGSLELNLDSLGAGVVRFAGANPDTTVNRGEVILLDLTLDVASGLGGEMSRLDLTVDEVAAAGDLALLTSRTVVRDGAVFIDPGPLRTSFALDTVGVPSQGTLPVTVWIHHGGSTALPGAASGALRFRKEILRVDSVSTGAAGATVESNLLVQADSGLVRWAALSPDPIPADSFPLAVFHLRGLGQDGDTARVTLEVEEVVNDLNFASLVPFLSVGAGPVLLVEGVEGIWGDTNFTWRDDPNAAPVSALDALVCLSSIVGKDVSQFDATACDVAPDADGDGDGLPDTFDGRITALDALAILTHVVGKTVPAHFRVGDPR